MVRTRKLGPLDGSVKDGSIAPVKSDSARIVLCLLLEDCNRYIQRFSLVFIFPSLVGRYFGVGLDLVVGMVG